MAYGWRKEICKKPLTGMHYWRVCSELGRDIYALECECGKGKGINYEYDFLHGNFFETKEKAENAAVDWITEIVNQMVLDGKFALKLRCLNDDELKQWENIRGIEPVVLGVE